MEIGDKGTVSRGTHRTKLAEVLYVDNINETYAVKFEDGSTAVINQKNLKTPTEAGVTLSQVVEALNGAGLPAHDATTDKVLTALEAILPGVVDGVELAANGETSEPAGVNY